MVMPSNAKATVASAAVLNSKSANFPSFEICTDWQGSTPLMTFRPLSCKLKNCCRVSSVTFGGMLCAKSRFDCLELEGLRRVLLPEPEAAGGFIKACSRLGSTAC